MGNQKRQGTKSVVPKWATQPFRAGIEELERLGQVLTISTRGISMLRGTPRLVEVLSDIDGDLSKDAPGNLARAKEEAALAVREVSEDFPVLHAWVVVAIWAQLESLIRTFAAEWLKNKRSLWKMEEIRKLKIRLGDYEAIPSSQRHYYIVSLLEKELAVGLRNGVQRFEELLDPFGLSGPVPSPITDALYELGQIRNLIAHNGTRIDRRFNEACPWLKKKIGTKLRISSNMIDSYLNAAMLYITILICRIGDAYGAEMSLNYEAVGNAAKKLQNRPRRKRKTKQA